MARRKVDWVKIDVEGAEMEVLAGLAETLGNDHPRLLVESKNLRGLQTFLERFGYNVERMGEDNFYCVEDG